MWLNLWYLTLHNVRSIVKQVRRTETFLNRFSLVYYYIDEANQNMYVIYQFFLFWNNGVKIKLISQRQTKINST